MLRIKDAISLSNERQRIKNVKSGFNETHRFVKKHDIAKLLWKEQTKKSQSVQMSRLIKADFKSIKEDWVIIICGMTGVDPNFLFDKPSRHDKDFNDLVLNK